MVKYPDDWKSYKLGDLGDVRMCKRIFASQTAKSGEIPFYKIGTFGGKADAYIPRALYEEYKNRFSFPKAGDTLLSAAGTIGRTVVYDGKDAYFQDSNIVWLEVSEENVYKPFLKYFFESYPWVNLEGTTISRLYNGLIRSTPIALPDISEQRSIAEALTSMDTHIANLTELIEKKKAIRDGALEDLVSGRTQLEGQTISWVDTELGELATYRKGNGSGTKDHYISTENINQGFSDIQRYSTKDAVEGCVFYENDTLIANIRPYLRKVWYAEFSGICSLDVLALQPKSAIDTKYLYYLVANDRFINYVMNGGVKGIKMPRGDKKFMLKYSVRIPSEKAVQTELAQMITSMDNEVASLEEERDKIQQIKAGMIDDLLTGRVRLIG